MKMQQVLVFHCRKSFENFRRSGLDLNPIILANFTVAENQDALGELGKLDSREPPQPPLAGVAGMDLRLLCVHSRA
jgi:hypothetical protein